jgi:hypothetical protein
MSLTHRLLAVGLTACTALLVVAPNAWAQERHVVDRSAMKAAVAAKAHADDPRLSRPSSRSCAVRASTVRPLPENGTGRKPVS